LRHTVTTRPSILSTPTSIAELHTTIWRIANDLRGHAYIEGAFRDGVIQQTGMETTRVLPPVSRFSPSRAHAAKKQTVIGKLSDFFERFFGLS